MMRTVKIIAFTLALLFGLATLIFIFASSKEQEDGIIARVIVWQSPTSDRRATVNYIVIRDNLTLMSQIGLIRNDFDIARGTVLSRVDGVDETEISDHDFEEIIFLLNRMLYIEIADDVSTGEVRGNVYVALYYAGTRFNGSSRSLYFDDLLNLIIKISPIEILIW